MPQDAVEPGTLLHGNAASVVSRQLWEHLRYRLLREVRRLSFGAYSPSLNASNVLVHDMAVFDVPHPSAKKVLLGYRSGFSMLPEKRTDDFDDVAWVEERHLSSPQLECIALAVFLLALILSTGLSAIRNIFASGPRKDSYAWS